ncbi:MAG: PAS domain-containing protein [Alphaproteobacteria bacterium]|nr:PAS domain-containing protein [Alphaproteobacteria bacterium]
MAEFIWDAGGDRIHVSARLAELTGLPEGVLETRGGAYLAACLPAEDRDAARSMIRDVMAGRRRRSLRIRFSGPNGAPPRRLEITASPIQDGFGQLIGVAGVLRDIGEEETRDAGSAPAPWPTGPGPGPAEDNAEQDHRVKNLLAAIQSLATLSARHASSMEVCLDAFLGRIDTLGVTHSLLTARHWRGVSLNSLAEAMLGRLPEGRVAWAGPNLVLSPKAANALGLALHELAENALKHGALSADSGRVDLRWRELPEGGFDLEWVESGGPPPALNPDRGFGRTLLERVSGRELGGEVSLAFTPRGLMARLVGDQSAMAGEARRPGLGRGAARIEDDRDGMSYGDDGPADISGLRLLVVEDAVLLALELETGLTHAGAKVVGVASNLSEAERMVEVELDGAVLDTNLNGRSVAPVAARLAGRGVPFIFATGYGETSGVTSEFAAPVVRKPYNVHQIAAALLVARSRALKTTS